MHSLMHDLSRFFMLFLEELFLIFNQMLSIQAFGRRAVGKYAMFRKLRPEHDSRFQGNSLPATFRGHICHLLIIFANNLDPDQVQQNIGPDLDSNCLTL